MAFHRILVETIVIPEAASWAELVEELSTTNVVAGYNIDRHGQRLEDVAQDIVLCGKSAVGEISGGVMKSGLRGRDSAAASRR